MIRPDELKTDEPLMWSPGRGTDVWDLFCACIAGELKRVQALVEQDPSLVRSQFAYRKPLYFAVRENRLDVAAFLLARDPDPMNLWFNDSPLDIARDRGYVEMEQLLDTTLATVHNASPRGEPVAAAIREHDLPRLRTLLDADPGLLHAGDKGSSQPIHWAVMTRQVDVIDELLARGADIDARRMDGARPIHVTNGDYFYRGWRDVPKDWPTSPAAVMTHLTARGAYIDLNTAAHTGDMARVRQLLKEDPSLANRVGDHGGYYLGAGTPLQNAAATGRMDIVRLLLEHGADPNLPEEHIAPKGRALYAAVSGGHYEIAQLLLERGANPNQPVESSADALSMAMMHKDQKMVDLLRSYGASRNVELQAYYDDLEAAATAFAANPGLADDPGALCTAAGNGNEAFVRLMLKYQPALPCRVSCTGKTRELTELLFAHGMNPSHPNWLLITPLHQLAREGNVERAALFIDHGADLHARDEDIRSTPLAWAAKFGRTNMVELLLARGAKPNLPDDPPWATPVAWAARRGHGKIVELLKQRGASS
jgi:ankyrin repeat protein